jgi:glutathione S-transferase
MAHDLTLYELGIVDGRSASPFVWRIKLSLARKGISYKSRMVAFTEIREQFEGRFQTVPILDFGDSQMSESIAIADKLDEDFPDRPAIFSCAAERAMVTFFDHWLVHDIIIKQLLPFYMLDAHDCAAPKDQDYYRRSREGFFGRTLEEIVEDRQARLPEIRRAFDPARRTLSSQPFLGGQAPNFADMCLLGLFIFAGTIGTLPLLAADDPLVEYLGRGLAAFGPATAGLKLQLSEPAA